MAEVITYYKIVLGDNGEEIKTVTQEADATLAEKVVNGEIEISNKTDSVWDKEWAKPQEGGRKRRSSKKSKKGGNKHTMGGKKSKKSKKSGKKSKKSRKH